MSNSLGSSGRGPSLLRAVQKLKGKHVSELISSHVFDAAAETHTSPSVDISEYSSFTLFIDLTVAGAPTDIVIQVQLSDDDSTFRTLMNGPFGALGYEDSSGDKAECLHSALSSNYMRLHVISSGCSAGNTFTLSCSIIASN